MKTREFIERVVSKYGRFSMSIPVSEVLNPESEMNRDSNKFGDAYLIGGMLETAKRRALAQNPIVPNAADIVNWPVWDTFAVAAATSMGASFDFFTQPIGTNNKTKINTNLEQVSRLPDPQWMNVLSLGFSFGPEVTLTDITTLVNNYYTQFWVGGKTYAEGRYEMFPSGTGIVGNTTRNNISVVTNGIPQWGNLFDLRLPAGIDLGVQTDPYDGSRKAVVSDGLIGVTILQGQNFKVTNAAPGGAQSTEAAAAGGQGMRLICTLYGILSRGVQ